MELLGPESSTGPKKSRFNKEEPPLAALGHAGPGRDQERKTRERDQERQRDKREEQPWLTWGRKREREKQREEQPWLTYGGEERKKERKKERDFHG